MTIGASRPLAPCTVITRTSSRAISMSRLTSARAARSQATKPLQRGNFAPLVIECEIEEFVERVVGFGAEPRMETPAAAAGAEHGGVKGKRRLPLCRFAQGIKPRDGLRKHLALRGFLLQGRMQRIKAALGRDREQIVVGKSEQRAAQHGRKRQIVGRQQQRVG